MPRENETTEELPSIKETIFNLLLFFLVLSLLFGLQYFYFGKAKDVTSRMKWEHTRKKIIDGEEFNLIKFTCENNDNYGFVAHSDSELLKHLTEHNQKVVEIYITTDGEKLFKFSGNYYTVPFIGNKPVSRLPIEMLNKSEAFFIRCK